MTAATLTLTDFLLARIAEDELDGVRHPDWCANVCDDQACDCDGQARTRAECDAKRRILERSQTPVAHAGQDIERRAILALLALPYADHPDYRDEWRP